jgi:hypothetical protein
MLQPSWRKRIERAEEVIPGIRQSVAASIKKIKA